MDKEYLHHYNSDGQEIVLSGQRKSNVRIESDYRRMLNRWSRAVKGGRLTSNGKHD